MERIKSLDNKYIKELTKLQLKKYRDERSLFLVEGDHLVKEAYSSNSLKEIVKCEDCPLDYPVKTTVVTQEVFKKLSTTVTPQKIIGVCVKGKEKALGNRLLLLDDIQDPGNLGTIIRSSVAFHIDTIILGSNSVDLYNDKVIRATEGMIFKQSILRKDLKELIPLLKEQNYTIYGTKVEGGTSLYDTTYPNKYALIMGNEGNGVKEEILSLCDEYLYIPMAKQVESLNVGVATSIILYEINRGKIHDRDSNN